MLPARERVQQRQAVGLGDVEDARRDALGEFADGHRRPTRRSRFADVVPGLHARGAAVVLADGAFGRADARGERRERRARVRLPRGGRQSQRRDPEQSNLVTDALRGGVGAVDGVPIRRATHGDAAGMEGIVESYRGGIQRRVDDRSRAAAERVRELRIIVRVRFRDSGEVDGFVDAGLHLDLRLDLLLLDALSRGGAVSGHQPLRLGSLAPAHSSRAVRVVSDAFPESLLRAHT